MTATTRRSFITDEQKANTISMELPEDVVRWISLHFKGMDREEAQKQLQSATIHWGARCTTFIAMRGSELAW